MLNLFDDIEDEIYLPDFLESIDNLLDSAEHQISNILPSEWYEENRTMTRDLSSMSGNFRYYNTPYAREIVDCLHHSHPAKEIAIMKAAQLGLSTGVVEPGIGWIIKENPGPILYLVGHADLVKKSAEKVDKMIDNTPIRELGLIQSSVKKERKTKSGDTDNEKQFPGGSLIMGISNPKFLRNFSVQYGFIDDFDAMKSSSTKAGDTRDLVTKRFSAFNKKKKIMYISSPELADDSNIEAVYLLGDQRKFHIPCPCCKKKIILEWECESIKDENEKAGITWDLDESGSVIPESIGYICQECGGFFDDRKKMEWLNEGVWIPTAKPSQPDFYSYHINALYAPIFMDGWKEYVYLYMAANPVGGLRDEKKWQSFQNLNLGLPYKQQGESQSATELQENTRPYNICTVPENLSIEDGNGRILLLTCAADIGGVEDDGRLDYEIVAWTETGSTYSIDHGSIGTFIPRDPGKVDRARWTYHHNTNRSIWTEFHKVLTRQYELDNGRTLPILMTGIDANYLKDFVFEFIETANLPVVGIKGVGDDRVLRPDVDKKLVRPSQEVRYLYLVENQVAKDNLAQLMKLKYDPNYHEAQPAGFMNFPTPSGGKYEYKNYFKHFSAEHKIIDKKGHFRWVKKSPNHENHLYDCRLYNHAVRDIFLRTLFNEMGVKNGMWSDYVKLFNPK